MVKMDDIAQLAGVSKASVSRVINNKQVSPEIRAKVEKIINELHYQPNLIAQSLTTKTTNVIGLIIPTRSNYYINTYDFITTCIDLLAEHGKVAIVVEMDDSESSFIDKSILSKVSIIFLIARNIAMLGALIRDDPSPGSIDICCCCKSSVILFICC